MKIAKFKKLRKSNNPQQELKRIIWLAAIFATFESKIETDNPLTDDAAFETLSAINNLTDPFLRGEATRSLFSLYEDNSNRYEAWNLTKKSSYLILLSLFLSASNIDEKLIDPILKCLNSRYYQNLEVLNPIHYMTSLLLKSSTLSQEEKEKILKLILQLEPPKKARAESKIAFDEKTKIYLKNREFQKEWVDACRDILLFRKEELLKNIQTTEELLTIHKKICIEFFEVEEGLSGNLANYFKSSRFPNALLTYVARLQLLEGDQKSLTADMLKNFVNSCLKGEFPNNRYDLNNNGHLKKIFDENQLLLEQWKKPLNILVKDIIDSDQNTSEIDFYHKVQNLMKSAIINHGHFKNSDELSEEFKKIFYKESYYTIHETIQTLKANSLPGFEIEIACLNALDPSITSNQRIEALEALRAKLPDYFEFQKDIDNMIRAMSPPPKLKLTSVQSAETWEDFLLMGTEVDNSCLSILGNPFYNRCLFSNILDGKNKVIVVKNDQGKIVARTVLRILLNDNYDPVLFVEKIYTKGSDSNLPNLIRKGCEEIANKMKLPLATQGRTALENWTSAFPFFGSLSALRGPAPFEYVDGLGRIVTQEGFTITNTVLILP